MDDKLLIVGAGPTGLAAGLFLAEKGIRSRIIDKASAPVQESRAQVINPRALELKRPSRSYGRTMLPASRSAFQAIV
jgi:2-polyprenyl-6-methoxyphenol hydroxylase-like FAD-dependent oxidoreductase